MITMSTDDHPSLPSSLRLSRYLTLASALLVLLLLFGCPSGTSNKPIDEKSSSPSTSSPSPAKGSDFDGDRAFEHVRKQVELGPRPPGSPELEKTRGYIIDQLKSYGLKVTTDEFHATTPVGDRKMVNVTAELPGESNDIIIVASHYDTKFVKQFKFVGANDGGASTGELLELARVMATSKQKPRLTYWFVFF